MLTRSLLPLLLCSPLVAQAQFPTAPFVADLEALLVGAHDFSEADEDIARAETASVLADMHSFLPSVEVLNEDLASAIRSNAALAVGDQPFFIDFDGTKVANSNLCTVLGRLAQGRTLAHVLVAQHFGVERLNSFATADLSAWDALPAQQRLIQLYLGAASGVMDWGLPAPGVRWPQRGSDCLTFTLDDDGSMQVGDSIFVGLSAVVGEIHDTVSAGTVAGVSAVRATVDEVSDGFVEVEHLAPVRLSGRLAQLNLGVQNHRQLAASVRLEDITFAFDIMWNADWLNDPDTPTRMQVSAERFVYSDTIESARAAITAYGSTETVATLGWWHGSAHFFGLDSPNGIRVSSPFFDDTLWLRDFVTADLLNGVVGAAFPRGQRVWPQTAQIAVRSDGCVEAEATLPPLYTSRREYLRRDGRCFLQRFARLEGPDDGRRLRLSDLRLGALTEGDLPYGPGTYLDIRGGVDWDDDGFAVIDNCVATPNADALNDRDGDGYGDVCDVCESDPDDDADGDGICGDRDNCPHVDNPRQFNGDGDALGDACDLCPDVSSDDNVDLDFDGRADPCDPDDDGDGVDDRRDNCPRFYNPDQSDGDGDGVGDACEPCRISGMGHRGCRDLPREMPYCLRVPFDPGCIAQNTPLQRRIIRDPSPIMLNDPTCSARSCDPMVIHLKIKDGWAETERQVTHRDAARMHAEIVDGPEWLHAQIEQTKVGLSIWVGTASDTRIPLGQFAGELLVTDGVRGALIPISIQHGDARPNPYTRGGK